MDTEDWQDLFLCGAEVLGSCQRLDGDHHLNRGVMGYCLDGKIRILAVKDKVNGGRVVARALLKVLKKAGEDTPVLLLERSYPTDEYLANFEALALEKAQKMGVELYRTDGGYKLESLGNVAGVEYEDGGIGVTTGVFQLNVEKITTL